MIGFLFRVKLLSLRIMDTIGTHCFLSFVEIVLNQRLRVYYHLIH